VTPFHIHYTLTRGQRVGELLPWLPAIAGGTGFVIGVAYMASVVSWWLLVLVVLPVVFYQGLFRLIFELVFFPGRPVELVVDETTLAVHADGTRRDLPLEGIIQVCRAGNAWLVLHRDRSSVLIPADAIGEEQVGYLKGFAWRAFEARKAARKEAGLDW
jgi:hypothetical protein